MKKYNNRELLIVTVGLPRSGKSTWAKAQGFPIVNRDSIRYALRSDSLIWQRRRMVAAIALCMVRALFLAGHTHVIVDETCTTRKRRAFWKKTVPQTTVFKYIATPADVCRARAVAETDAAILPVIDRMAAQFEPLGDDEFKYEDFNIPAIQE